MNNCTFNRVLLSSYNATIVESLESDKGRTVIVDYGLYVTFNSIPDDSVLDNVVNIIFELVNGSDRMFTDIRVKILLDDMIKYSSPTTWKLFYIDKQVLMDKSDDEKKNYIKSKFKEILK